LTQQELMCVQIVENGFGCTGASVSECVVVE